MVREGFKENNLSWVFMCIHVEAGENWIFQINGSSGKRMEIFMAYVSGGKNFIVTITSMKI